ncbi:hypothetical protein [uncultured Nostoc sp.]|uniref:hypothetical protein n=1 Tax=uncultured Nostoc sp. TaxID=340711 RepID=UPI0026303950|nr:hypothetical protein [uncultured Nostoc sp.]
MAHAGRAIAKIKIENLPAVQQLVDEQPDAILSELCERLAERSSISVSISTMHRAVQQLELTNKKNFVCQ